MSLTKLVGGKYVDCTSEEESEILEMWAKTEAKPPAVIRKTVDAIINDPEQLAALKAALAK